MRLCSCSSQPGWDWCSTSSWLAASWPVDDSAESPTPSSFTAALWTPSSARTVCRSLPVFWGTSLLDSAPCSAGQHRCISYFVISSSSSSSAFVGWWNKYQLSVWVIISNKMAVVDMYTIAAYLGRPAAQADLAWSKDRRPSGAVLHSSNEPGELSQWLCRDDSTINITIL